MPAKLEQRIVRKIKLVEVPDGNLNCNTTYLGSFATTNCTQGTKLIDVPYTDVETVDVNKGARDAEIGACTRTACVAKYKNADCKAS